MSSDTPRQLGRLERSVVHLNRAESSTSYVEFWSWRLSQAWLLSTSKARGSPSPAPSAAGLQRRAPSPGSRIFRPGADSTSREDGHGLAAGQSGIPPSPNRR